MKRRSFFRNLAGLAALAGSPSALAALKPNPPFVRLPDDELVSVEWESSTRLWITRAEAQAWESYKRHMDNFMLWGPH